MASRAKSNKKMDSENDNREQDHFSKIAKEINHKLVEEYDS